jgi:DNA-binding response OmpR family regulator
VTARILVVEDDRTVAEVLIAYLNRAGYDVEWSADGVEALERWQRTSPDIVILDLMLPDTTGFDVLQRMKSHPALADVPVVIVTGQATRESVVNGLAFGADGYFTKPFEIDVLLRGMKAVLGQLAQGR